MAGWRLTLSDRSFPGAPPGVVFERARRIGIPRVLMHDEALRPLRTRRWWPIRGRDPEDWQGVSQWAEALDYRRPRLHAVRFERLRAGVRLTAWSIAPRPPQPEEAPRIRRYAATAAVAAAFLGAQGLLLEGMDRWEPEAALAFLRQLLPILAGLRRTLWVRLAEASPLWAGIPRAFGAAIRPWVALDLEGPLPRDFPSLWDARGPAVSMVLLRGEPEPLAWWAREGRPVLERAGFEGELVVTFPEATEAEWARWGNLARAYGLEPG